MVFLLLLLLSICSNSLTESNCYNELGCFPNIYPWYSVLRPALAAVSPDQVNTTFFLINRQNGPLIPVEAWPKVDLKNHYDSRKPTFIITHGFKSDIKIYWCLKLANAILSQTEGNVFLVDWKKGSSYSYLRSLSNTRIVAAEISRLIRYLINHNSADTSSFHLLGHSLGAHIMSYVGKNITGIARITALDPARPGFQGKHPAVRLNSGDAKFIDVLHTDGRPLLGLGMTVSVGNVDFYFNGGIRQPKCRANGMTSNLKSLFDIPKITIDLLYNLAICSHVRAPMYMVAAVEECHMWGYPYEENVNLINNINFVPKRPCTNKTCTVVGLNTPKYPQTGKFVVRTTGKYPYCST